MHCPPARRRALINVHVNLGLPRLLGFRRFLAAAQAGDHELAAVELLDSKAAAEDAPARYLRLADDWRRG